MADRIYPGGEIPKEDLEGMHQLFPNADEFQVAVDPTIDPSQYSRLIKAGLGIAQAIGDGLENVYVTYHAHLTPQTYILRILRQQQSVHESLDDPFLSGVKDVMEGTFDDRWQHFYPLIAEEIARSQKSD